MAKQFLSNQYEWLPADVDETVVRQQSSTATGPSGPRPELPHTLAKANSP